ncbi:MAG: siroheme synthase, partial [Methylophaga sp.]|nr:siroheme synthase [Methylophaga sp.]
MDFLPIFLDLKQQPCLVVGGGEIAARKAGLLVKAQATVTIVAPALSASTQKLVDNQQVHWLEARFDASQLSQERLVIAATDDASVNEAVYEAAKARNILVNVADSPDHCDFILASILDRSPIVVAVSSGGDSPVLARNLRARLETLIPPSYSKLGDLVGRYRDKVKQKFENVSQRRRFWESVLEGPVADHIMAGREALAEKTLLEKLQDPD